MSDLHYKQEHSMKIKELRDHPHFRELRELIFDQMADLFTAFLTARSADEAWVFSQRGRSLFGVLEEVSDVADGADDIRRELAARSEARSREQREEAARAQRSALSAFPSRNGLGVGP